MDQWQCLRCHRIWFRKCTGVTGGTAIITYSAGDCYVTAIVTVDPSAYAGTITGSSTVTVGGNTTFSSPIGGGVWLSSNPSKATVGASTGIVTGVTAGSATIYYFVANSCGTASASHGITVTGSGSRPGLSDDGTTLFSVYPNPTAGALTVLSGSAGTVTIYTIDGRAINQYTVTSEPTTLSLPANIASGIYLLKFNGDDGSSKIVRLVYER